MLIIYDVKENILFQDDESSLKELVEKNKFDLRGAKLTGADLTNIFLPIYSKWNISYMLNLKDFETSDISKIIIKIGCKEKTIKDWNNWFNSDEEFETKRGTEEFKQIYANYVAVRKYLKIIVKGED